MATVTRYRCPVTPDECPTSTTRGFCPTHEWERLVPERVFLADEVEETAVQPVVSRAAPGGGEGEVRGRGPVVTERPVTVAPEQVHGGEGEGDGEGQDRRASGHGEGAGRVTGIEPTVRSAPARLALVLAGTLVPLRGEGEAPTRLGRDAPECAHVSGLDRLDQISREHAELYWESGQLYIRDTRSSNGTFVDGKRIHGPTRLWPGTHRLRLAQDVDLTVVELDDFGAPV
ncbi:FHA domain-containing protein [Streptomyces sp. NPDC012769]|uniref:FHA domain-containing protein n=1 Tax=Streptomyces sp. NPDC012769 TaxID=3364848 RepID=UPI0036ADE7C4